MTTTPYSKSLLPIRLVCPFSQKLWALCNRRPGASGFVAKETIQLSSLSASQQAFGAQSHHVVPPDTQNAILGLAGSSNVTFVDNISGILGLGFPRLSQIHSLAVNGVHAAAWQ